jgi:small subunit ribosomal protein S17
MVKKERVGIVVSNKPEKTIIVAIQIRYQHPKYGKTLIKTKRYMAHDEHNKCKPGDIVVLEESAPISKYKKWRLKEIVKIYEKENKQGKKQVNKQEII